MRGQPPLDMDGIIVAVQTVADLLISGAATSIDINPVMVSQRRACAVDALIEVSVGASGPAKNFS